jgi:hypothetical protein
LLMDALLRIGTSIHTPGHRVQRSAQFGLSPGLSDRLGGDSKFRYPARQWSQNYVTSASRLRTPRPKPGGSLTRRTATAHQRVPALNWYTVTL